MHSVQLAALNVWNAIQNVDDKRLENYLSDEFEASMLGWMDGEKNKMKLGKKEMVATCMLTGQAVKRLFHYDQKYHLASWGKEKRTVFIIDYDQSLTFTPTTPPEAPQSIGQEEEKQDIADASSAAIDQEKTNQNSTKSAMLSRGVQAWEWIIKDGTAIFTTLHNVEVDKTRGLNSLDYLIKTGKICNLVSGEAFKQILDTQKTSSRDIHAEELSNALIKKGSCALM